MRWLRSLNLKTFCSYLSLGPEQLNCWPSHESPYAVGQSQPLGGISHSRFTVSQHVCTNHVGVRHPHFDRLMSYGNIDDTWGEPQRHGVSTFTGLPPCPHVWVRQVLVTPALKLSHGTVWGAHLTWVWYYYIWAETIIELSIRHILS